MRQLERSSPSSVPTASSSSDAKTGIRAELAALAENIPVLRKLVENQEVSHTSLSAITTTICSATGMSFMHSPHTVSIVLHDSPCVAFAAGCILRYTLSCWVQLQVSPEEWQSIMKGLLTGSADLANAGYMGQGHFYRCPNGHPYVIGDCGGATQTSFCPECRAPIGGTQHRVVSSNTQHDEMNRMAREFRGLWH